MHACRSTLEDPTFLAASDRLCLAPGYEATVVWPETTDVLASGANGCSLVLWARGPGRPDLFLMGDLEADGEARIVARQSAAWSAVRDGYAVLKAGHHGSRTSSTPEFLAAIDPEVALVSVGATNRYGHPGAGTLSALTACGATVLRTDVGGAVRLVQRGSALWLERPGEPARALTALPVDVAARAP